LSSRTHAAPSDLAVPTFAAAGSALLARWPETRLDPTLDRVRRLCEVLDHPERAVRAAHLTGTNGKTSTARMVEALLRAAGQHTGRFTSPHLESITERISIGGEPLTEEAFRTTYNRIAKAANVVDDEQLEADGHRLSFFEAVVGMALATFRDAHVDAAVIEVGMGGSWDATNVVDAPVAVLLPIAVDHADYLGRTPELIAREKAGIIKAGATAVLARQLSSVDRLVAERAAEVGAHLVREGVDFAATRRTPVVGGQMLSLVGLRARYEDIFLPLSGPHQAQNAATAVAAVEAFLDQPLQERLVQEAFADVTSPGRLEVVSARPHIVLDAAHNPHGAAAAAAAMSESTGPSLAVGVVSVMADKDCLGILEALVPILSAVVCTQNSTERSMSAENLAESARTVFDQDQVHVVPDLADAIDRAVVLAASSRASAEPASVLVTGSVVTVGEARALLKGAQ
jgi:dihydrofolate synthase/folylpolyglutamate synthase